MVRSEGDVALIERVMRHLAPHYGAARFVYHDLQNDFVHVDVHVVLPSDASGTTTLFTTGMSERYMTAPPSVPSASYARTAELVLTLPGVWPTDEASLVEPTVFWPYAWLRYLARFPFRNKTFLASGHTVPIAHDPRAPRPPCPFAGVLLRYPHRLGDAAMMARGDGPEQTIFLAALPLFASELALARAEGFRGLLARFAEANVDPELADVSRRPVV